MIVPSQGLLSEVYGEEVDYVDGSVLHKTECMFLGIRFKEGNYHDMPLCSIAEKCKDWAFNQKLDKYVVSMKSGSMHGISSGRKMYEATLYSWYFNEERGMVQKSFEGKSEAESVFMASEWLLMNRAKDEVG